MNWMPTLAAWPFAVAGVAAATATLLIHLLNRRRPRTIEWGAMEFLREALRKRRRTIRLRDAILLLVRCAAALLFGLALARPHFAGSDDSSSVQPVHLILVIDNSLSMAYETLDGTLLARAKQSALRSLEQLPSGSVLSVIAAANSSPQRQSPPSSIVDETTVAVDRIRVVDRPLDVELALARVEAAAKLSADLPIRVVFYSDMQRNSWQAGAALQVSASIGDLQLVDVSPAERDNTAVLNVEVSGGFAIASQPATIIATIGRSGGQDPRNVEVTLAIDDVVVASKALELTADNVEQRVLFRHRFEAADSEKREPNSAVATVRITADRLPLDDVRYAIVPVFPAWPLLCVDRFEDEDEDPALGKLGETHVLRKLLVASSSGDAIAAPRHVASAQLRGEHLASTRAIAMAGVRDPAGIASRLREFVEGGGQLLIAAGGDFDPAAWNANGWLGGRGILPAPIADTLHGETPSESQGSLAPWIFDADSLLGNKMFLLEGNSPEELAALYNEPLVFKRVAIETADAADSAATVLARLRSAVSDEGNDAMDEHAPLLIERQIGAGRVLFFASSLRPTWNTLANTNAVVILDVIARDMIRETLLMQNVESSDRVELLLPIDDHLAVATLSRPGQPDTESLAIAAAGERLECSIDNANVRGIYRIRATSESSSGVLDYPLAINGPAIESHLAKVNNDAIARLAMDRNVSLTNSVDSVSLRDLFEPRHSLAWWTAAVVLLLLVAESVVLMAASLSSRSAGSSAAAGSTLRPEAGHATP